MEIILVRIPLVTRIFSCQKSFSLEKYELNILIAINYLIRNYKELKKRSPCKALQIN